MNNKKIIFGILLFVAISFIAYTFASPDDKEEGKMTYGNGTNEVNSPNDKKDDNQTDNDLNNDQDNQGDTENNDNEDDNQGIVPIPNPNPGNSNSTNVNRPTGGNSSSQTRPTTPTTPTTPTYTVSVSVPNGSVNVGSQTVKKGNGVSFTIGANNGYTLDNATVSGGCTISGNTVSANNVNGNMTCTVTLDTERIYANVASLTDGVEARREGNKLIFSGTMTQAKTRECKTGRCVAIKLTATKMIPATLLNNFKITMGYSGNEYGIADLTNKDNALNQTERPYYTFNQEFRVGQTYKLTIDWGTGKAVEYELDFSNVTVIENN